MARSIYCPECHAKYQKGAQQYGEFYEAIEGEALFDMFCDGAHREQKEIKKGDTCFAACLLDSVTHPKYSIQAPEVWADEYIIIS